MRDLILFAAFPYVATVLAVVVFVVRYRRARFTHSSLSSQFLESRALFWGSVPWHYGILVVLGAHFAALLWPAGWAALIAAPVRLWALEVTGLAFALAAVVGLGTLIVRRLVDARAQVVTSAADWLLLAVLFAQIVLGFWIALAYRWGSDWYLHTAVPWLVSLAVLAPEVQHVTALPWLVKLHMLNAFVIVALFPFTRLVHLVALPLSYLWRPYQVVIWYRRPAR
jgi:nitrate reductase gamma subunit